MLEELFPNYMANVLDNAINLNALNEIRVRINKPLVVVQNGIFYFLDYQAKSLCTDKNKAYICDNELRDEIFKIITEQSMYAINNQLIKGFISFKHGIRIGVCGEMVYENDKIITIKNISSINIRFPHNIKNCSANLLKYVIDDNIIKNTLIISPPGAGKTTMLRDLAQQFGKNNYAINVLILDERNEIAGMTNDGKCTFEVGCMADVCTFTTKEDGFTYGIRSMSPNVIITDEIATKNDVTSVQYAINSGVTVIASTHAKSMDELIIKPNFEYLIKNKLFDRYIVLSTRLGYGTIEGIYNKQFKLMEIK